MARFRKRSTLTHRSSGRVRCVLLPGGGATSRVRERNGNEVFMANQTATQSSESSTRNDSQATDGQRLVKSFWGVRYQVKEVSRSINFYTQQLGFKLDHQHLPAFGQVSLGNLKLILS